MPMEAPDGLVALVLGGCVTKTAAIMKRKVPMPRALFLR